ncbi:hypothetical protein A3A46_01165 [Candidatus Roizmanbacteria bacterium RIFCSPLOWO2_01_FULL_37_13]|uniref:Major facilitator superfamily (MFS) profile domain-containing protein n=1 Tax=Candidatus Roizmanbacteria bacterium RIFCSPHIGHO2_02_FULL_38_11 TaxID=1802039 RepID=A0A1F7GVR0_9BACT|nr:MAG: hypothetical protein A3C25_03850 [Candidatus Roizmanbacteria bacterium RIFCSPHIGHO2_02_FULL_38_11]OGK41550.1 MAG: hypothetical protein A3A46_01165 [Candidatus Roizmanbacteria bacterium RIFCSPLOWO2_01_FULL_37_13]
MKTPFLTALKIRDFRLLWVGLLISAIGSSMQIMGVTWHLYNLTHSAFSLALIGLVRFVPLVLFSLIGGIIADIFDRRKIVLMSNLLMTLTALLLAWATYAHVVSPFIIYFVLIINSIASSLDTPARQSFVPQIVPKQHWTNALGLIVVLWQVSLVLGPSIGGFVIAYMGIDFVYFLNFVSFIPLLLALLSIQSVKRTEPTNVSFNLSSIKEGLRFVRNSPMIYSTMLLDFFATFFSSATVLLPIFAQDILLVGPKGLGLLYAAPSVGAIIAGMIFSSFGHIKQQGKILLGSVLLYGLTTVLFGFSKSFYLSLIFLGLTGVGDVVSTIIRNTIRYLSTPDYIRGRMSSINMIFFVGGPQLGELEAGLLAGLLGSPVSVVIGGVGTIIATAFIAFAVPKLRKYQGHELIV